MCAQNQETAVQNAEFSPKTENLIVTIVYPSWTMRYALASFANLLTLAIGITIGLMLAPRVEKGVQAGGQQSTSDATPAQSPLPSNVEQIRPVMTVGSIGAYQILSHHIQSDELVVNGLDILKLEQGELNLLARVPGVYSPQVQSIVDDARNTKIYQVAPPTPAPQPVRPPTK